MYIRVEVVPEAKKESIQEIHEGEYVVSLTESARGGRANKRLLELLRAHLGRGVRIAGGHHHRRKLIATIE